MIIDFNKNFVKVLVLTVHFIFESVKTFFLVLKKRTMENIRMDDCFFFLPTNLKEFWLIAFEMRKCMTP